MCRQRDRVQRLCHFGPAICLEYKNDFFEREKEMLGLKTFRIDFFLFNQIYQLKMHFMVSFDLRMIRVVVYES
jgi:hypothetical protein